MAKQFGYYDDWKSAILECPTCGWTGTFEQGSVGYYDELKDSSCPSCDPLNAPMLAIVSYPRTAESRANWDKLSDEEKDHVERIERFQSNFEARKLRDASQLPVIESPSFTLYWNLADSEGGHDARYDTLIELEDGRVVFREPACYEGYERFIRVAKILRTRYGSALRDLIPRRASKQYLYGDRLSSCETVDKAREEIFSDMAKGAE